MFDCGVIDAELLEVSLVKLAPAVRVMAKPGPGAGARGDVLRPLVDAGMLLRDLSASDTASAIPSLVLTSSVFASVPIRVAQPESAFGLIDMRRCRLGTKPSILSTSSRIGLGLRGGVPALQNGNTGI